MGIGNSNRPVRSGALFAAILVTLAAALSGSAQEAGKPDFEGALRKAAAEIGWPANQVEVTSRPDSRADDDGNVVFWGDSYFALRGYGSLLTITANRRTDVSPTARPYVDLFLRESTARGHSVEKLNIPLPGSSHTWRVLGIKEDTVEREVVSRQAEIYYIALAGADAVMTRRFYGQNERPDEQEVRTWATAVLKHLRELSRRPFEHALKPGQVRLVVDHCAGPDGKRIGTLVTLVTKDGRRQELFNDREITIAGDQIRSIRVEGKCGATLYLPDGTYVRLESGFEEADLRGWGEYTVDAVGTAVDAVRITFKAIRGAMLFVVPPSRESGVGRFQAETNSVMTSPRGTVYTLSHDDRVSRSLVQVKEGSVLVTPKLAGAQPFILQAGYQVEVTLSEVGPVVSIMTPPAVSQGTKPGGSPTGRGAASGPVADLTGYWRDDSGSCYRVRQVGSELLWHMDGRPNVVNVFYGIIAGNNVDGEWADLPCWPVSNSGTLALKIESGDRLVKIGQSAAYGASTWSRVRSCQ
jgi:hypothetical protein